VQAQAAGGPELDARRTGRVQTVTLLRQGRTPLVVIAAAEAAVAANDEALRAAVARQPRAPAACREGCAWCCYQRVGVAAAEVLRIAAYLRENLSTADLASLQERVRRGAELRGAAGATVRLPCALLVEDRCAAYPVRPLTCRGFNSSDARRCEQALATGDAAAVPAYAPQQRLAAFVLDGLRAGLQESRLDGELLELTAALHLALSTPDALWRYLAGESVFAGARLR
jgi:Fe-S-cluster containining protein